jgi:hypothetical protein
MKYFAIYSRESEIKNIEYIGDLKEAFIHGATRSPMHQAQVGAQFFYDPSEHDVYRIVNMEELKYIGSMLNRVINDSNFPVK